MISAYRIETAPNTDHMDQNHSGIATRCPCGGRLDREGLDLAYCEECGAEYLTRRLRKAHHYHLTRVP